MGNICCQADIEKSALETDLPKASQYEQSILPENDGVLKEWLDQNNIQIGQNSANQPGQDNKPKAMKHKNKNRYYYGTWKDNLPEGQVLIYEPEKILFSGNFYKGLPEGKANIKFISQGCDFEGGLKQGRAHGEGTTNNLKLKYGFSGIWEDSRPKKGTLTLLNDPNIATIEFEDFEKGKGIISYKDYRRYEGDISIYKLVPHGKGKVTFPFTSNKSSYEGDWVNGVIHGKGKFIWKDNSQYEGDFINGRKQGYARFTFPIGTYYQGTWLSGKQGGVGILYDKNGIVLKKGKWVNGVFESQLDEQEYQRQNQIVESQIQNLRKRAQHQLHAHAQELNRNSVFHNEKEDVKSSKEKNLHNSQKENGEVHYFKQQHNHNDSLGNSHKKEDFQYPGLQ